MTIRAVILGLLAAVFIAAVTYLNDHIWLLSQIVSSHMPVFIFGLLVVLAVLVNPLLFLANPNWRLKPKELAVCIMLMLAVCSIPSYGFLTTFTRASAVSANIYRNRPGWNKNQLRETLPSFMLPGEGKYLPDLTETFMRGAGSPDAKISLAEVPWRYWQRPLTAWLPLVVLMAGAVICLGLIIHRQWSQGERLRYPIAEVASTFMQQDPARAGPPLFRSHMFWWGLGIVLFIRVSNGIYAWSGGNWINIPLYFSFDGIWLKWQLMQKADWWSRFIFNPQLFPTVIAIAFLLASDVGLSLGIAPICFTAVSMFLLGGYGVGIGTDDYMRGGSAVWQRFGSYLAIALVIAYTGRRYYWDVLTGALAFRKTEGVDPAARIACRLLILFMAAMMVILTLMGLDWPFAILAVMLILLAYLGMARINCESGLFLNLPRWQPIGVLLGLFGAAALGPKAVLILSMLSIVFTVGTWECFMPFFMNGLRLCTNQNIKPGRAAASAGASYVLGLLVAVPVILWACHNYGVSREPIGWSLYPYELPSYVYDSGDNIVNELKAEGKLTDSLNYTPIQRIRHMEALESVKFWKGGEFWKNRFIVAAGIGLILVLLVSYCRLRLPWWPIHPVLFMVWGTRQMAELAASFLLGWIIKSAVTHLGGMRSYQKAKTLMFGVIAGDLLGGLIFMAVGAVYYFVTGKPPLHKAGIFPTMF